MKIFKDIRIYLIIILTILCLVATYMFSKSVLPLKYLIMVILIFLFLILSLAALCYQKNKIIRFFGIWFGIFILIVGSVGIFSLNKAMDVISEITNIKNTVLDYTLICKNENIKKEIDSDKKESPFTDLSLYKSSTFGIIEVGDTTHNGEVVRAVRNDLGSEVEVESIKSIQEAYDRFINGDIEVLILNNSLKSMFNDDITNDTQMLAKYSYKIEVDNIRKEAKVTKEPFLIYISGVDTFGDLNIQARSDVNKFLAINPNSKKMMLIDIPRDYYIPQTCQYNQEDKLTHTGFYSVSCTTESVENYFDLNINYYARINFSSLVNIVDALGGINVHSDYNFVACDRTPIHVGDNLLNGNEALDFARDRNSFEDGDNQRIKNQTLVLEAIIDKVTSPEIISHYGDFMDVMGETIETNLNKDEIYALIQMQLSDMASWEIESYSLLGEGAILYSPMNGFDSWVMIPDETSVEEAKTKINEFMSKIY